MKRLVHVGFAIGLLVLLAGGGFVAYRQWEASRTDAGSSTTTSVLAATDAANPVRLSPQARKNLELTAKPLELTTYWRKIEVPAVLTDFHGISDRGVVAPVTGIVTQVFVHPGEIVEPNIPLFTLRLVSESLHASQRELFKATREIEIARKQRDRLSDLVQTGALPQTRILELDNQIQRSDVTVQAHRQDLKARGLLPEQIEAAATGEFVTEIQVRAPSQQTNHTELALTSVESNGPKPAPFRFELQELRAELGQQVEAGQVLCKLADHRLLLIEGRGFKEDLPLVQKAAEDGSPVEIQFDVPQSGDWPAIPDRLQIHHVANSIDPDSRTFSFDLILENQWRTYERNGQSRLLWRFRPGDRARLLVPVEKLPDVFVLPKAAVVREGPESYVFRQNGDLFDRRPIHVIAEDSTSVVIVNDGSVRPGWYIGQSAAASVNRVLKSQATSGMPANVHVHADGTVHDAHK
jgi:membrane fusion protein, heavy metal efflux system